MDTVSVSIDNVRPAGGVGAARDSARSFLEGLAPALAPETAATVVVVVSELVTDARRHGGGACALRRTAHPDGFEVTVQDHSPRLPRTRAPTCTAAQEVSACRWSTFSL
ncbi:ATP-binding protein [Streptomyces sp. R301]|uniref:ATP-binding protein n=1 Tax=unclassified Streptomyces TaxID=2593676 RepID=UPI003211F646